MTTPSNFVKVQIKLTKSSMMMRLIPPLPVEDCVDGRHHLKADDGF